MSGHHDGGFPVRRNAPEQIENRSAGGRIQVSRWLIGQKQPRVVNQGAGDGHALHLAAGKLVGKAGLQFRHLHPAQAVQSGLTRAGHARQQQRQLDILHSAQRRKKLKGLEDETNFFPPQTRQRLLTGGAATEAAAPAPRRRAAHAVDTATGDSVTAPMQATVVKVAVTDGDEVVKGDLVLVLEAMKMEQPLTAHKDCTIAGINAAVGETVSSGHLLLNIV